MQRIIELWRIHPDWYVIPHARGWGMHPPGTCWLANTIRMAVKE